MSRDRFIRLQIMLDNNELDALETWRFKSHMPSRASAVRELIRRGLSAQGFKLANAGESSESYGVVKTPKADKQKT